MVAHARRSRIGRALSHPPSCPQAAMTAVEATLAAPQGRKASKDVRRLQLIEATIDVMARKGYAGTTMADVAKQAGLSSGIVNFHFETKENLLAETLKM